MAYTERLESLGAADLPLAGGKGANLGELLRAGFNVPRGFVLTTAAYRAAVAHFDLSGIDPANLPELQRAAAEVRSSILGAPLPRAVEDELLQAYRSLGTPPVAVRSSAILEDLPGASFAGQQESFLNVAGEEALLRAVPVCWASLWSDRAVAYRAGRGFPQRELALAVVVQGMAPHRVSGVVFTVNPVSGERGEMVINAVRGSGEVLVSGRSTPDQWVARRADGGILHFSPGPGPAGPQPFLPQPRGCLRAGQVSDLVRLALQVEAHFGGIPQDIEWSLSGDNQFYLLQSRPVTALGTDPSGENREGTR